MLYLIGIQNEYHNVSFTIYSPKRVLVRVGPFRRRASGDPS